MDWLAHETVASNQGTPHLPWHLRIRQYSLYHALRTLISRLPTHHPCVLPLRVLQPASPALPNCRPRPLPPQIYMFFLLGGTLVSILSGVPFLFSFSDVCLEILEIYDITSSRRPVEINCHPTPNHQTPGWLTKVILGALPHPRTTSLWWKFFWIVMGTLHALSIVLSYFLLGRQKTEFVFIWAGFQLFGPGPSSLIWLKIRIPRQINQWSGQGSRRWRHPWSCAWRIWCWGLGSIKHMCIPRK